MKISTHNSRNFKKNQKSDSIEEEKNNMSNKDSAAAANPFTTIFNFNKNSNNLNSETKNNSESKERSMSSLIEISVKLEESENAVVNKDAFFSSLKSLKELVNGNEDTVKKTLPGLIISLLLRNKNFATEDFLINFISPIIGDLRKPDGSKYKVIFFLLYLF